MSVSVALPHQQPGGAVSDVVEVREVTRLKRNPLNPRSPVSPEDPKVKELAGSIRETKGPLEPLLILRDGTIVAGERRWVACQIAEIKRVRVIVKQMSEQEQLIAMMAENVQRADLDPLEEAHGYVRMEKTGLNRSDIARRTGIVPSRVTERLKLLDFPEDIQQLFKRCQLPISAVHSLAKITDEQDLCRIAGMVVSRKLTLPALDKYVKGEGLSRKKVNYERKEQVSRERRKGVVRDLLVNTLTSKAEETVTIKQLLAEMDFVCCACGMSDTAESRATLCAACPLAAFLNRFANIDVKHVRRTELMAQTAPAGTK